MDVKLSILQASAWRLTKAEKMYMVDAHKSKTSMSMLSLKVVYSERPFTR